jgi:hypothetical protein
MIKTSKHSLKFINNNKQLLLNEFLSEYSKAVKFFVDYLFHNSITYMNGNEQIIFSIKNDLLNCPKFISTTNIE